VILVRFWGEDAALYPMAIMSYVIVLKSREFKDLIHRGHRCSSTLQLGRGG